jgi:hypothetical protein
MSSHTGAAEACAGAAASGCVDAVVASVVVGLDASSSSDWGAHLDFNMIDISGILQQWFYSRTEDSDGENLQFLNVMRKRCGQVHHGTKPQY